MSTQETIESKIENYMSALNGWISEPKSDKRSEMINDLKDKIKKLKSQTDG